MNNISLEINGVEYEGWESISITKSIDNLTSEFSLNSSFQKINLEGEDIITNPIKLQDKARVFIDGNLQSTGTIENLAIAYNNQSHTISVSGRDRTGDLIDSSIIQKQYSISSFKRLVQVVLSDNGYSDIKVINNVPNIKKLQTTDPEKAPSTEDGDTIFSFLDRYAKKVQVLINTDQEGNIVINREGAEVNSLSLISEQGNPDNNIKTASVNLAANNRFRFIEVYAQDSNDTFSRGSVSQSGKAIDSQIRAPRRLRITSRNTSTSDLLKDLAKWHINIKRGQGTQYSCVVQGYYSDREQTKLWDINTLVEVRDDKCQIYGVFLINSVTFTKDLSGGSITTLTLVNKGSYTLDIKEAININSSNQFASNLIQST